MSDYQIHPIAECYPPPTPKEYERLKVDIAANGLQKPIVLFEGKNLCGVQRSRACRELGIQPDYITPKILDPIAYVISDNEMRRHWTHTQLAIIGEKLAGLKNCRPKISRSTELVTQPAVAKRLGISDTSIKRIRSVKKHGIEPLITAVSEEKLGLYTAAKIAQLPKEAQFAALEKQTKQENPEQEVRRKTGRPPKRVKPDSHEKAKWTPEEEVENEACLAIINAPSKFPVDALIPKSNHHNDVGLREAIDWLRKEEPKIASYNDAEVFQMQLRTNRIQAYKTNWGKNPRPDGELDQRILDWASDLWLRERRQDRRLELLKKLRAPRKPREKLEQKAKRSFDDRFKTFWMLIEDNLGRLFRPYECKKLIHDFRKEAKQFFSDLSAENRGAAVVADAQKDRSDD